MAYSRWAKGNAWYIYWLSQWPDATRREDELLICDNGETVRLTYGEAKRFILHGGWETLFGQNIEQKETVVTSVWRWLNDLQRHYKAKTL